MVILAGRYEKFPNRNKFIQPFILSTAEWHRIPFGVLLRKMEVLFTVVVHVDSYINLLQEVIKAKQANCILRQLPLFLFPDVIESTIHSAIPTAFSRRFLATVLLLAAIPVNTQTLYSILSRRRLDPPNCGIIRICRCHLVCPF